jgi:hypothetical protein
VRQLRIELANEHFANSSASFFTHSLTSPTDTADVNKEATMATGPDTQRLDGSTAVLQIIRLGLSSLAAPQPPPHPDDLIHVEITRKVRASSSVVGQHYLFTFSFLIPAARQSFNGRHEGAWFYRQEL